MGQDVGPYRLERTPDDGGRPAQSSRTPRYAARAADGWFQVKDIPGVFSDKEWLVTVLLSAFLGTLGVDRFFLGYIGLGIAQAAHLRRVRRLVHHRPDPDRHAQGPGQRWPSASLTPAGRSPAVGLLAGARASVGLTAAVAACALAAAATVSPDGGRGRPGGLPVPADDRSALPGLRPDPLVGLPAPRAGPAPRRPPTRSGSSPWSRSVALVAVVTSSVVRRRPVPTYAELLGPLRRIRGGSWIRGAGLVGLACWLGFGRGPDGARGRADPLEDSRQNGQTGFHAAGVAHSGTMSRSGACISGGRDRSWGRRTVLSSTDSRHRQGRHHVRFRPAPASVRAHRWPRTDRLHRTRRSAARAAADDATEPAAGRAAGLPVDDRVFQHVR